MNCSAILVLGYCCCSTSFHRIRVHRADSHHACVLCGSGDYHVRLHVQPLVLQLHTNCVRCLIRKCMSVYLSSCSCFICCKYVCMYACMYTYACTCIHMHVYVYICMYMYTHACIPFPFVYILTHMHKHIHPLHNSQIIDSE